MVLELIKIYFLKYLRKISNKSDGIGLGLFIVKKICDNYGFKINLTTDKGHGFKISIIYKK